MDLSNKSLEELDKFVNAIITSLWGKDFYHPDHTKEEISYYQSIPYILRELINRIKSLTKPYAFNGLENIERHHRR